MSITQRVASTSELRDGEMKEVQVGEKKALLAKVNGHYFATGNLCTHLKANLVKGTLSEQVTDKGSICRVVCPLHGASFNLGTGDIEDAPALDALPVYQVKVEGEDIFITANETALAEGKRNVEKFVCPAEENPHVVVIIGGGAAAYTAIHTLRDEKFKGKIILISKENHLPIDRVKLSKSFNIEVDRILLKPAQFYDELNIERHLGKAAVKVNPQEKKVTLDDGSEISFNSLILCTGGDPRFFWGDENKNLSNVFLLRGASDAIKIDEASKATPNAEIVIVGSSFIGMEAAAVLVKGAKSVTVIGMEKVPFERVLGEKIGLAMQKLHESKNIKFKMGAVVDQFEKTNGKCTALVLKSGERIPCDFVVVGAGVSPSTEFLKDTFELAKDGSLVVDKTMKVKGFDDIYAAGDIARFPYHFEEDLSVRIEHWSVAEQQGRVAAKNIAGVSTEYTSVPFFWTMQYGKSLRYVGHALIYDDVIIEGSLDTHTFIAYFTNKDKVAAVCSLGKDPACSNASELMRLNKLPTATEIRAGKSVLETTFITTNQNYTPPAPQVTKISSSQESNTSIKPPPKQPAPISRPRPQPSLLGRSIPLIIGVASLAVGYYFYH